MDWGQVFNGAMDQDAVIQEQKRKKAQDARQLKRDTAQDEQWAAGNARADAAEKRTADEVRRMSDLRAARGAKFKALADSEALMSKFHAGESLSPDEMQDGMVTYNNSVKDGWYGALSKDGTSVNWHKGSPMSLPTSTETIDQFRTRTASPEARRAVYAGVIQDLIASGDSEGAALLSQQMMNTHTIAKDTRAGDQADRKIGIDDFTARSTDRYHTGALRNQAQQNSITGAHYANQDRMAAELQPGRVTSQGWANRTAEQNWRENIENGAFNKQPKAAMWKGVEGSPGVVTNGQEFAAVVTDKDGKQSLQPMRMGPSALDKLVAQASRTQSAAKAHRSPPDRGTVGSAPSTLPVRGLGPRTEYDYSDYYRNPPDDPENSFGAKMGALGFPEDYDPDSLDASQKFAAMLPWTTRR